MQPRISNFGSTYLYALIVGAVVGFLGGNAFRLLKSGCIDGAQLSQWIYGDEAQGQNRGDPMKHSTDRNLVLIGVVTKPDFLATRIVAANNTWMKDIPGKVVIFIPEGSSSSTVDANISGIEIVELAGIGGSTSAHKKLSRILKYMYDHYLDKYRFLMIVDDDLFIRADQVTNFLHALTPSQMRPREAIYGKRKETAGRFDEYYCIGNNAMFVPRVSLARVGRSSRRCARNAFTSDEGLEFERCWTRLFTNVTCKRFDQEIFAPKYRNVKIPFNDSLGVDDDKVIGDSIVLQDVDTAQSVYRLRRHFLVAKTSGLRLRLQSLTRDSNAMDALLSPWRRAPRFLSDFFFQTDLNAISGRATDDPGPWLYSSLFRGSPFIFNPHAKLRCDEQKAADKATKQIALMSKKTRPRGQANVPDFEHLYARVNRLHGLEYILRRRKRPRTSRNSQIYNLYARLPYLPVEMEEEFRHSDSMNVHSNGQIDYIDQKLVRIILSLTGRYSIFLRFMSNFEDQILKTKQNVSLLIVLFHNDPNDTSADVSDYIERLQRNYDDVTLSCKIMKGKFSRGRAFQAAVQDYQDDDLLFFADIDLILQPSTLQRVRLNTKRGERVYAPMFFSEYNRSALPHRNISETTYYSSDNGYWRKYSFGMVSCYKSDFIRTGGYRLDIEGWGLEDVELTDKIVESGITMFRSVDVRLMHKFHPIICEEDLRTIQLDMCFGTMATSLASQEAMAEFVYRTSDILNRN